MNIEGLDYNTQRKKLVLPEYGREIQMMVDDAIALPTKQERQKAAENIVSVMKRMVPQAYGGDGSEQKMWDHLALMSNFELAIDWPFDVSGARSILSKPEAVEYPMKAIPVRHYGNLVCELLEKLRQMSPGKERDELVRLTANQMKRDLVLWSHGSADDEKVAEDIARFTDGKVQLDLDGFKFNKVNVKDMEQRTKKKKK